VITTFNSKAGNPQGWHDATLGTGEYKVTADRMSAEGSQEESKRAGSASCAFPADVLSAKVVGASHPGSRPVTLGLLDIRER